MQGASLQDLTKGLLKDTGSKSTRGSMGRGGGRERRRWGRGEEEEGWVLKITIVMLLAIIVSKLYVSINLTSESLELLTFMLRLAASFNVLMNPLSVMTVM